MPWRNGGGETLQIAAGPAGADLATFAWRVSVAIVARSGPFSSFPGVVRTLALIDGAGVRLAGATSRRVLTARDPAVTFDGSEVVDCELVEGVVRIFNVMVRGVAPAAVAMARGAPFDLPPVAVRVGFVAQGEVGVQMPGDAAPLVLASGDAFLDERAARPLRVTPRGSACMLVALIDAPARPAAA